MSLDDLVEQFAEASLRGGLDHDTRVGQNVQHGFHGGVGSTLKGIYLGSCLLELIALQIICFQRMSVCIG